MSITSRIVSALPYSDRPDVRKQIDELFSRKMLGAVLVGKFVGDYAALKVVQLLGVDIGYILGIIISISVFIYWERIEKQAQAQSNKMNPAQTRINNWNKDDN